MGRAVSATSARAAGRYNGPVVFNPVRTRIRITLLLSLACLWAGLAACGGPGHPEPRGVAQAAEAATASPTATATAALSPTATETPAAAPSTTDAATPRPAPSATPCAERRGRVTSLEVPSATLHYDIDTLVYVPPCYSADQRRYPALYLIHGLSFTEAQWVRLGIADAADKLILGGDIAPLIIVLPRDRLDVRLDPAFVKDLVPYIDSHYRTLDAPEYRAIGGLSRGGGWSIRLGLHYPETFGRIGAHSPAIFYGDEKYLLQWTRAILKRSARPAIYIDVGDGDGQRQSAFWLDQVFTSVGLKHTYLVQSGGHSEKYWSAHVADYLRFYAAGWLIELTPTPTRSPVE